jgi:cytochrome c oxidase accessory protein FixG
MTTEAGSSLYESAVKIYPRSVKGRFARLRIASMLGLLGLYYLAPWITLGGNPLICFDLPHRQFHILGLTLVPQDLFLLTLLLMAAAFTLFFFTTLAGRLWCGYACPQTVWTEAFLLVERWTEGDRHSRMRLDQGSWDLEKLLRKGAKHFLWLAFAMLTGFTFVAYFVPARALFTDMIHFQIGGWPLFWGVFYGFATWGNAGFMREQVCKYMCPYARFQAAMFDRDTLIISYNSARGEPRKSVARKLAAPAGDCVDCTVCVQVCPTGIDIRKGLQYECIACAACVDACDAVMDAVDKPRGLIRYTSANEEAGNKFRLLRPRAVAYGLVWLSILAILTAVVLTRLPLQFDVMRDRHTLYREIPDGSIENVYVLKIDNEDARSHVFHVGVTMATDALVSVTPDEITVGARTRDSQTVSVRVKAVDGPVVQSFSRIDFTLTAKDDVHLSRSRNASFLAGE